ncbi:hypothetical protein WR25_20689 [Diploscapter pachys]|uniref:RING-type domain-containing protein n=1 Tax=Diploscapter pachys TaxID=2018661 RepID=A0A2A2J5J0_9BILA|nr:hypothetical protein WR25_20689 [Diploscapter pachys]
MVRMLRTLFDKVIGSVKGVKNKYPVKHVEGCDNIVIDSSILCCPICYNVYASVPSILKCGHTFCTACLQTMIRNETPTLNERYELVFHCPLCREQCTYSNLTKNYLVEDLLQSIQEVPQNVEDLKRFSDEGARIIRKRLEGRNKELEQQVNKLQDELGKREKREKVYSLFVIVVITYTFLAVIKGIFY